MPVRSRGSLLAGTAILAGLLLAGSGCHSSPSDHDSFSIPNTPAQPSGGLLSRLGSPAMQAGYPAQPVMTYAPVPVSDPASLTPCLSGQRPFVLRRRAQSR